MPISIRSLQKGLRAFSPSNNSFWVKSVVAHLKKQSCLQYLGHPPDVELDIFRALTATEKSLRCVLMPSCHVKCPRDVTANGADC